jgi:ATP-dependent helicase/DNAse subunit B
MLESGMPVFLYLAPAASGKTAYVLKVVREAAQGLQATPRVIVPSHLQVRAWRHRLAEAGGAVGVRILTFDRLYAECLGLAGEIYTELSEPVQYRLIRAIVSEAALDHFSPLRASPGFIQILEQLIAELKAARIWPETFSHAVAALGDEPRLRELANIYTGYQARLQARAWADHAGQAWLAVEALEERAPDVAIDWPLVVVDGFDSFTPVQLALLEVLAGRVNDLIVTLTGTVDGSSRPLVHRRFEDTRRQLEEMLGVQAIPLPQQVRRVALALAHLETHLFRGQAARQDAAGALELIEAPDRADEVRAALRWLKARLLWDGMRPDQVALVARSISPYRPFITQIAAEFGLPIRLVDGLPLRTNPAISALLDLLRLMLPRADDAREPILPRRLVIEAWRSPYFDWSALPHDGAAAPIGIAPADADALDAAARWGRVIEGRAQWEMALSDLASRSEESTNDDQDGMSPTIPIGERAEDLLAKFRRFVERLTPPQGQLSFRDFVGWLEGLIGPDPGLGSPRYPVPEEPTSLQVVAQARDAPDAVVERDVSALQALKDVLRGLVWAEEALDTGQMVGFNGFFEELVGAIDAATYRLPTRPGREEILVADAVAARGIPFRAVAVLGLAEGEFPSTLSEDPFLRDIDRRRLREGFDLSLQPSTESAEAEFFYEAITRPRERLLLTRPRLADNGSPWQASPFWEETRRLVDVTPQILTSESIPMPDKAASWPELMESLATFHAHNDFRDWVQKTAPARQKALDLAVHILGVRSQPLLPDASPGHHNGDLTSLEDVFRRRFGPRRMWSASRLEAYRTCPFSFFVGTVLGLEPREEPSEGLDARQLGNIYHRILEQVYRTAEVSDPHDLEQLVAALPSVAGRVLDKAPEREGFRETAWWAQTRDEIRENVQRSLVALAEIQGDFVPLEYEAAFGLKDQPELVVRQGDDQLRLCGFIDRVDRAPDGRLRIIDYKTAGPWAYTNKALTDGKRLQLPLYALGARDALGMGEPTDGFYWHVQHAQASPFTLGKFGAAEALEVAVEHAWTAVRAARQGHFVPQPPSDGCPSYCPAAAFCWHYSPGFGG